jgi:hypothetical protein
VSDSDKLAEVDWLRAENRGFGALTPTADFMHGKPEIDHFSVTETWWFEAIVPEHALIAHFYIAARRNLNMCAAGVWMWRGHRHHQISADHLNFRTFLPTPVIQDCVVSVPSVGLSFEILKPLETSRLSYRSPDGKTTAELEIRGLMAPVMRANEKHFEQAVWVTGTLVLEGEPFQVNGPAFRDRSWGEKRPEDSVVCPPIGWLCGVLDNGKAAFNISGFDDPERGAEWAGVYDIPPERLLNDGWIYVDGDLQKIVRMSKRTERIPTDRMRPSLVHVDFEDAAGRKHELRGLPKSGFGMHHWPNIYAWFGLTEWELDGMRGLGDTQDYCWSDYCKRYWR